MIFDVVIAGGRVIDTETRIDDLRHVGVVSPAADGATQ